MSAYGGAAGVSYQKYGISKELVESVKLKLKDRTVTEGVKSILHGVTKADLQNEAKLKKLLVPISKALGLKIADRQKEAIIKFVIAQKIDPNNTFHLIKLWGMFR
jgi:uncharacterized protein YpuA (DUF1002 family)